MKKPAFLLIVYILLAGCCFSQLHLEPLIGYTSDLSNSWYKFRLINTGIQAAWKKDGKIDFLLKIEKGWGMATSSGDSSFTLNPSLPLYSGANKTIRPGLWSAAAGVRLKVAGKNPANALSALMYLGLSYQKIRVKYQYDKSNYVVLNPDQTQERTGAFVSGGLEYMRFLTKGRIFVQAVIATAPIAKKLKYPSSFGFISPLSINAGYSFPISTKK